MMEPGEYKIDFRPRGSNEWRQLHFKVGMDGQVPEEHKHFVDPPPKLSEILVRLVECHDLMDPDNFAEPPIQAEDDFEAAMQALKVALAECGLIERE